MLKNTKKADWKKGTSRSQCKKKLQSGTMIFRTEKDKNRESKWPRFRF